MIKVVVNKGQPCDKGARVQFHFMTGKACNKMRVMHSLLAPIIKYHNWKHFIKITLVTPILGPLHACSRVYVFRCPIWNELDHNWSCGKKGKDKSIDDNLFNSVVQIHFWKNTCYHQHLLLIQDITIFICICNFSLLNKDLSFNKTNNKANKKINLW